MGRTVELSGPPKRIISLVPSQTELLATLGLDPEVVGITKFCVHPKNWYQTKMRVGGTKSVHFDRIAELKPDLIIGNKEENDQEVMEQLMAHYPVWMSEIYTLSDALQMILQIGELCDRKEKSVVLERSIREAFTQLPSFPPLRTLYLIWNEPIMAAGGQTFIDAQLQQIGLQNVLGHTTRYPQLDHEQIREMAPELILLSSEPFPFKEKHIEAYQNLCPQAVILLADGELFSWYGSRLIQAPAYFATLRKNL